MCSASVKSFLLFFPHACRVDRKKLLSVNTKKTAQPFFIKIPDGAATTAYIFAGEVKVLA